jgi:putative ABC transport system permease protein
LGRSIVLDDSSYTIIGVLPSTARLPRPGMSAPDIWLPLDIHNDQIGMPLVGRLRPGVTIDQARADLDAIYRHAHSTSSAARWTTRIVSPGRLVHFRDTLLMLVVAVAVVLLVSCANVAHLQLARAGARTRELAIRASLGAGRRRLLRQLLTESMLLSLIGGAAGVFVGWLGLRTLVAARPDTLPELATAHIDTFTLALTLTVALASGVVFGLVGAMHAGRASTNEALKAMALTASRSRASRNLRALLVVSEMGLSATLLVAASLLVRSVIDRQRADLGFDPRGLYAVEADFPNRYATAAARSAFNAEAEARIRALPGVSSVAVADIGPGGRGFSIGALEVEGEPPAPAGQTSFIDQNEVTPSFFTTLRIRLVEGGTFTDTSTAAHQVIVNEGFARRHWARGSALGHRVRVAFQGNGTWRTIVGVAADASPSGPTMEMTAPMLYLPHGDNGSTAIYFRTTANDDVAKLARDVVRSIDPALHPTIQSVAASLRDATAAPRFIMSILSAFTLLALVLATIGLYGVMSHAVAEQTREIGIRVALGATRARIGRQVITRGSGLAVIGLVLGLSASHWATKLIQNQLYGVAPTDALSLIAGGAVLIGAALVACIVPTRRALAIDPIVAIRAE